MEDVVMAIGTVSLVVILISLFVMKRMVKKLRDQRDTYLDMCTRMYKRMLEAGIDYKNGKDKLK